MVDTEIKLMIVDGAAILTYPDGDRQIVDNFPAGLTPEEITTVLIERLNRNPKFTVVAGPLEPVDN